MSQRSSTHSRRAATVLRRRAQLPSARQAALLTLFLLRWTRETAQRPFVVLQAASFVSVYRAVPLHALLCDGMSLVVFLVVSETFFCHSSA